MIKKSAGERLSEERKILSSSLSRIRLKQLFDDDTFMELDANFASGDSVCSAATGFGYISGTPVYAFSQDSSVNGGAMERQQAMKISKLYSLAATTGMPVVGIFDSKGADLSAGTEALSAYGELMFAANRLSGVVPQISVILGTCAGCAAMMAASSDVVIAVKDAELFMTAAEGDTSAENAARDGTVQLLAENEADAFEQVRQVLLALPLNNLSPVPETDAAEPDSGNDCFCTPIVDGGSAFALSKDFGCGVKTAFARIGGLSVGIVNAQPESSLIDTDDCVKAARFVRLCDSFALPVITFIDAAGFAAASGAASSVRNAAMLSHAYAEATCPKISVVIGKAYGAVYTCLAGKGSNADLVFALDRAVISPLSPEASVIVLSPEKLEQEKIKDLAEEYAQNEGSAFAAAASGQLDGVISQSEIRSTLLNALDMLSGKRAVTLSKKHSNMPL